MLPPHELKNKTFTKSMRGYNPVEVDEYIEFVIEKYTEIYRENDELERKLKTAVAQLDEIKGDEDSIRSALIDAKRAAANIRSEAEDRAEAIIRSAKSSCNTILADFNTKIEEGRAALVELKRDTIDLKRELFDRYSEHIKYLDKLTEGIERDEIPETDELRHEAVMSLKKSISEAYSTKSAERKAERKPEPEPEPEPETYEEPTPEEAESEYETETGEADADTTMVFTPAHAEDAADDMPVDQVGDIAEADGTVVFDRIPDENSTSGEGLTVNREPLDTKRGGSLKDSIKELNRRYKAEDESDVINTPDSDVDDEGYLDFVKSVTGKSDEKKEKDFDMLFSDNKKKK